MLLRLAMGIILTPVCAQWCIFSIVRANSEKNMTFVARLLRALHRAILSCFSKPENVSKPCFFQCPVFLKNPLLFKNITCCSPIPRHMQKHCLTVKHTRGHWYAAAPHRALDVPGHRRPGVGGGAPSRLRLRIGAPRRIRIIGRRGTTIARRGRLPRQPLSPWVTARGGRRRN